MFKQKISQHAVYTIIPAFLLLGCAPQAEKLENTNSQRHLLQATLYAQSSAEYEALCLQAYTLAKIQMKKSLAAGIENPAVVLDLDETILDNSPYTGWQIKSGNSYKSDTWAGWVSAAEAEAIPGSIEFLQWADSNEVKLFYISNRKADGLAPTIKNLKNLKAPQADSSHIYLRTTTSDKSKRRAAVDSLGVNVVLYIGDNLGDYSEIWDKPAGVKNRKEFLVIQGADIGTKYISLPNPMYGTWEGALFNYDSSLSGEQLDSLRLLHLRAWDP
ncbi:MAG: 5'-nucleotidase, lipoprotein e(P4) family [Flavobacteriales bacterium]|nr:5'-nucleotidase, lipoprotein e(P4) family [Flavobacteriales bacterium]